MNATDETPEGRLQLLLRTHGRGLRRVSQAYERAPAAREELWQEILLALWKALPGYRGDASLRTFAFRVAHNTAIKHARRDRRDRSEPGLPEELAATGPDPDGSIDRRRARERLLTAIHELPEVDRQLVTLHLEGLSNQEVADVVGMSASNVGTRLARSRARLRRTLEARHVG